jgi:hypothetical protein
VAAPYRSGSIHEIRYHASQLGSGAAGLDGLIYTGVLTAGGGFEDRLYARSSTDAGQVHGRPAVATVTIGGNEVVAWEVAPGMVAYLGYSGAEPGPHTVEVLRHLASRAHALCGRNWRASSPQRTEQQNDFRLGCRVTTRASLAEGGRPAPSPLGRKRLPPRQAGRFRPRR